MFDISIPIAFDSANGGFVTVIWHGDDWDYYPISLVDGFDISDLIKYWLRESFALIIHKRRKRGILPMQISCDVDGRLGCLGGYGVFLNNGKVHIIDERIFRKTCAICPHEWWKCVDSREFKNPKAVRWIVPEKDFLAWVNRLETLMHVRDCMIDTFADHREIRGKNSEILGKVLCDIAGGKDFLSILPFDWMERGRVIVRSGLHGRGKTVELSEYTGMAIEFHYHPIDVTA